MTSDSADSRLRTSTDAAVVPLRQAPSRFVADAWSRLVSLTGNEAEAVEALNRPDPGFITYYRRQALSFGVMSAIQRQKAQTDEEIWQLTQEILDSLRNLGLHGRFLSTGLFIGTGLRQDIPPELWANATFEFGSGRLVSGKFEYHTVTLRETETSLAEDDLENAIREWLVDRRVRRGDEKKSPLQAAARDAFGDGFTVRVFNAAYSAVYERKRGRPEKRNK